MNKAGRTRDEVIKDFGERPAPGNTFPGAAQPNFSTFPAIENDRSVNGDNTDGRAPSALPYGGVSEYRAPSSNLPMAVSASQVRRDNCDRGNTPWDVEAGETGPLLSGTAMTASAVPVAKDSPEGVGEAIAEGDVPGMVSEAVNTFTEPVANLAGAAAGAMGDKGNRAVEDAFSRLRRMGGGR